MKQETDRAILATTRDAKDRQDETDRTIQVVKRKLKGIEQMLQQLLESCVTVKEYSDL